MRPLSVAVLGATGAVGRTLLEVLAEGDLAISGLRALASERSAGTELEWQGDPLRVEAVRAGAFRGVELAFLAVPPAVAREWAPRARDEGALVVDLSPAHRADADVPLVLAELDAGALERPPPRGIVATPGAAAAHLALVLAPLRAAFGVERVDVTLLEAVSAAGQGAVSQLEAELRAMLAFQEPPAADALPHRIAFNVLPQAGAFDAAGASEEERAVAAELSRLLGGISASVTALRVPVFHAHLHVLAVETGRGASAEEARSALRGGKGLKLLDSPSEGVYPMPMLAVADDAVHVGRVRAAPSRERVLELVAAGDNLRSGAAANAVRVAKILAERHLPP